MWWNAMSTLQQTTFIIGCVVTAILIIQILMMIIGGSSDADVQGGGITDADGDFSVGDISDVDADIPGGITDADGDVSDATLGGAQDADADISGGKADGSVTSLGAAFGLRLLSLRSIIAFLAVGCWMCYTLCYMLDWYWALIISVVCGFAAACAMAGAIIGIEKMQGNGNLDPQNAIGKIGTVYLTVPPSRSGKGKVNVVIQERFAEYEAITDSGEAIKTAAQIKVTGYAGNNVLIVEKYKQPAITVITEE